MALYLAEDGITPVTTQSMVSAFRKCPREAYYKYVLRLSAKVHSAPLTRGKWIHSVLEAHYLGEDWRIVHKKYTKKFAQLFDEEKEKLGDLPREIELIMKCYFWYYGDPAHQGAYDWKVHGVEEKLEAMMPNGHLLRGVLDMIVEDEFGLWIVDHKSHKNFPDWNYRMLDDQSSVYTWLARENDIPVKGFIWNYIGTSGFPKYEVLKSGKNFYSRSLDANSVYPAFVAAVKAAKAEYPDTFAKDEKDLEKLKQVQTQLKSSRWGGPDMPANNAYFRRDVLEKTDDLIERALVPFMRTSDTMHAYDFSNPIAVERNINECKGFICNFKSLTMTDLISGDSDMIQRRDYKKGDPLAYQEKGDNIG